MQPKNSCSHQKDLQIEKKLAGTLRYWLTLYNMGFNWLVNLRTAECRAETSVEEPEAIVQLDYKSLTPVDKPVR